MTQAETISDHPHQDMDRHIVSTALERANFNLTAAARRLGTTRQTLRYRVRKYGLAVPASGDEE